MAEEVITDVPGKESIQELGNENDENQIDLKELQEKTSEDKSASITNAVPNEPLSAFSDEAYSCDRDYAIMLAQLMANKDREKVYKWIERLLYLNYNITCTTMDMILVI